MAHLCAMLRNISGLCSAARSAVDTLKRCIRASETAHLTKCCQVCFLAWEQQLWEMHM